MSVICFCRGFSYSPFYRGVRNSGVAARRELTVSENKLNLRVNEKLFHITG